MEVTTDYLMEGATEEVAKTRIEDRELIQQFQKFEKFPNDDKFIIKKTH